MARRMKRRTFLQSAVRGGAGLVILGGAASARSYAANEKMNIALVGVGGRGGWFVGCIPRLGENLVALCDVNERRAADGFKAHPKARKFDDFRVMFDKMDKEIDAVIVATPDNTHAVITAAAMKANKHVYCEKPLTKTVRESRILREIARKQKVATSMGNQGTASGQFRRALELIRDGTIGEVKEVHAWNTAGGRGKRDRPAGKFDVPAGLNWDLWLGPAAYRPYHPHWMWWHSWRDFGTGNLGNWATHSANLAFMALKVDSLWHDVPSAKGRVRVKAEVSEIDADSFPTWETLHYDVPARGELPPLKLHWYNGSKYIPGVREVLERLIEDDLDWGDKKEKRWADHGGCVIVGTKGRIHATSHCATFRLVPAGDFKDVETQRPKKVDPSRGHERDWLGACRGGKPAWASFEYAVPLVEFLMLGNVATQFKEPLEFDPQACKVVNNAEADRLLHREYREGWSL
jgi:hypothetical protein